MTAVVILALLMVPVFFVSVLALFNRAARLELKPSPGSAEPRQGQPAADASHQG
jgi:hypothetical protein